MDNKQNNTGQADSITPPMSDTPVTAQTDPMKTTPSETNAVPLTTSQENPISATPPDTVQPTPAVSIPNSTIPPVGDKLSSPPKKSKAMLFMMIIVLLIIVAAGAYFFYTRESSHVSTNTQGAMIKKTTMIPVSKPTTHITPITPANVDQTLNNTDATMQQAMNQANTDLNSMNQIDTTQDSTAGL